MIGSCRICLFKVEPTNCVNIFTESRNNELVTDILVNFASIVIYEDDPKLICSNCLNKLYSSYDFKNLIIHSDIQLQKQKEMENDVSELNTQENDANNSNQPLFIKCENYEENLISFDSFSDSDKQTDEVVEKKIENWTNKDFNTCDNNITNGKIKSKRKTYGCTVCKATFKNSYRVAVHKRIHTGTFAYSCELCSKGFPTNYAMNVHRRIHFEERPFKCKSCEKSFKSPAALIIHKKTHLEIRPYQCKTCGKTFVQLGGLKTHEQTHTNEKHYICEFCSKSFNQNSYLTKHLKTHKEDTRLPCPVCGKTYACLRLHLKCHSDVKTKNFCCEVCNKKFALKTTLNIHMRIHKGIKPYSCGICDKKFTQSTCLVRHMRIHTGETPYPCDFCDKRFSYTHHRLKHVKREHPNEIIA